VQKRCYREKVRAQILKAVGALVVVGLLLSGAVTQPAVAATYPSWSDVLKARKSAAAKAAQVKAIQATIAALQKDVADATAWAQAAGEEYQKAQEKYDAADQRAQELQAQAEAAKNKAADAKTLAGRLGAELYRSGGSDLAVNLMLQGGDAGADQLLSRLGSMSKLVERSSQIYAGALAAENEAKSFQEQAKIALAERARLQAIAQAAFQRAQAAQQAMQQKLDENEAHGAELQAQLAALQASSAATAAQYKVGVEIARQAALAKAREEAAARGVAVSDAGWTKPSDGYISDGYGPRTPIWTGYGWSNPFHRGLDFADSCGSPMYAASGGTVTYTGWYGGLGYHVEINHGGGIVSTYSHISSGGILVKYGEQVGPGQRIARTGTTGTSTGCHLHFMVYVNGSTTDPRAFLKNRGVGL
jgi:murein DD-endopeptidase MepM/ murein hydrolase activator NlpD